MVALLLWRGGRVNLVVPILVRIATGVNGLHHGRLDHGLCRGRAELIHRLSLRGSGGSILLAERPDKEQAEAAEHGYGKAADHAAGDGTDVRFASHRWPRQLAVKRRRR